jgi:alanyl-tRNA synthetase
MKNDDNEEYFSSRWEKLSIELCGWTHVSNTKDIGRIAIISLTNKGADTFRLEGATTNNINSMLNKAIMPYDMKL